jgi:hypothetical protein
MIFVSRIVCSAVSSYSPRRTSFKKIKYLCLRLFCNPLSFAHSPGSKHCQNSSSQSRTICVHSFLLRLAIDSIRLGFEFGIWLDIGFCFSVGSVSVSARYRPRLRSSRASGASSSWPPRCSCTRTTRTRPCVCSVWQCSTISPPAAARSRSSPRASTRYALHRLSRT